MSLNAMCPFCNQNYEIEKSQINMEVTCVKCGQNFMLDTHTVKVTEEPKPQPPSQSSVQPEQKTLRQHITQAIKKNSWVSKVRDKGAFSLALAIMMLIASGVSFKMGIDAKKLYRSYPDYRTDHKSYNYYGDLISHLHYKAALEVLAETERINDKVDRAIYYIEKDASSSQAVLYYILSACLFAGASTVLTIRCVGNTINNSLTQMKPKETNA